MRRTKHKRRKKFLTELYVSIAVSRISDLKNRLTHFKKLAPSFDRFADA